MRFASVSFFAAIVLFVGGATSALGSWAVAAAGVVFLIAAVVAAVAMEERDLAAVEGLVTARPAPADVEPVLLDAA